MISVIVVNFNALSSLERCLRSVEPLRAAGHQVLLVDNASEDGSVAWVEEAFPSVEVVALDRNVGFGAANNVGAARAHGEFLLLLNPDAWLENGCAERLHEALERQPLAALAAPRVFYPDGRRQFNWSPTTSVVGESVQKLRNRFEGSSWAHDGCARLWKAIGDPGWYSGCCLMVRAEAWRQVGGFDEDYFLYFEDADLCSRLLLAGWRLEQVAAARAGHDKGGARGGGASEVAYRRAQLTFYRKWRSPWQSRFVLGRLQRRLQRLDDGDRRRQLLEVLEEGRQALES